MHEPVQYHSGRFPPTNLDWPRLIPLVGPASAALARYDALLQTIPNPEVLLAPLVTQEAVLSSRIEGTQTTVSEVLQFEAEKSEKTIPAEKREDIEEVLNYRKAMQQAVKLMDELPIRNRLLRELHRTLLSGVRGHDKARGEFRTIQNYIAFFGRRVDEARFIPIGPGLLQDAMREWERYVHGTEPDVLVQLAVVHAEFESLHPFVDGNGRIGRMIVPLFLFERGLLHQPMFYLSEYLEAHRQQYYDRLLAVSQADDWTGWCEFFLQAITQQASQNEAKARRILNLYDDLKDRVVDETRSPYAVRALDFVFGTPVFSTTRFLDESRIPESAARRMIGSLSKLQLLETVRESSGRRPAVYAFLELLDIADSTEAPK